MSGDQDEPDLPAVIQYEQPERDDLTPQRVPIGRPSVYRQADHDRVAQHVTRLGGTIIDVADAIGVHPDTIQQWRAVHPSFSEAILDARDVADDRVVRSLYERAIGYSYEEDQLVTVPQGKDEPSKLVVVRLRKHMPPETKAMDLWLRNRRPHEWRKNDKATEPVTIVIGERERGA